MKVDLTPYRDKTLCVAVSGGKDSMALLHYVFVHAPEYGIELCALNCDHAIRGAESERDSRFVSDYCREKGIPLLSYCHKGKRLASEEAARVWRYKCFSDGAQPRSLTDGAFWRGYDFLATAHHADDNAETVLFNLARGSGIGGACGIAPMRVASSRREFPARYAETPKRETYTVIRPLLGVTRAEIDDYVRENQIPYVVDSTNLSDDYTRNKIRRNVLPALRECFPGVSGAIARFSAQLRETEEFLDRMAAQVVRKTADGYLISFAENIIFKRAAVGILREEKIKDYTSAHLNALCALKDMLAGKRYEFLGMAAVKEQNAVFFYRVEKVCGTTEEEIPFSLYLQGKSGYGEDAFYVSAEEPEVAGVKRLRLDKEKIPEGAVVRRMRPGDTFRKFGGGRKKLGDFFTDRKISVALRKKIPLIAKGSEVYVVGGVEISDEVKIVAETKPENIIYLYCAEPARV